MSAAPDDDVVIDLSTPDRFARFIRLLRTELDDDQIKRLLIYLEREGGLLTDVAVGGRG